MASRKVMASKKPRELRGFLLRLRMRIGSIDLGLGIFHT